MKKYLLLVFVAFISITIGCSKEKNEQPKYLKITNPVGDETYRAGQQIEIRWESSGIIGNVNEINITSINPADAWWIATFEKDLQNNGHAYIILPDSFTISVLPVSYGKYFKIQLTTESGVTKAESKIFTITP